MGGTQPPVEVVLDRNGGEPLDLRSVSAGRCLERLPEASTEDLADERDGLS